MFNFSKSSITVCASPSAKTTSATGLPSYNAPRCNQILSSSTEQDYNSLLLLRRSAIELLNPRAENVRRNQAFQINVSTPSPCCLSTPPEHLTDALRATQSGYWSDGTRQRRQEQLGCVFSVVEACAAFEGRRRAWGLGGRRRGS